MKVDTILSKFLYKDLRNVVFDYAWGNCKTIKDAIKYGNYEYLANIDSSLVPYLKEACESGFTETIKLIIEKGANDWEEGLYGACKGGHMEIIDY